MSIVIKVPLKESKTIRADAQQNRAHILEVATKALSKNPAVSLNAIAKAAGVGPGTLYRHFPSREALIVGVYLKEIFELVDLSTALLVAHTPIQALRLWLDRLAHFGRIKYGFADELHAAMTDDIYRDTYGPMVNALRLFIEAGIKSGDIRRAIDPEDMLHLLGFLWHIKPGREGEERSKRLREFILATLSGAASDEKTAR